MRLIKEAFPVVCSTGIQYMVCKGSSPRVHCNETHLDVGASFFQFAGDASDRPPRAGACHQHVQFTCEERG